MSKGHTIIMQLFITFVTVHSFESILLQPEINLRNFIQTKTHHTIMLHIILRLHQLTF